MDYEELKKQAETKTLCVQIQVDLYNDLKALAKSHKISMRKIIEKMIYSEINLVEKNNLEKLFQNGKITINPSCSESINAFKKIKYKK